MSRRPPPPILQLNPIYPRLGAFSSVVHAALHPINTIHDINDPTALKNLLRNHIEYLVKHENELLSHTDHLRTAINDILKDLDTLDAHRAAHPGIVKSITRAAASVTGHKKDTIPSAPYSPYSPYTTFGAPFYQQSAYPIYHTQPMYLSRY